jgi:hypothetical protein
VVRCAIRIQESAARGNLWSIVSASLSSYLRCSPSRTPGKGLCAAYMQIASSQYDGWPFSFASLSVHLGGSASFPPA